MFHVSAKLIASYSDIDKAFESMHQSIMAKKKKKKKKNCDREDWVVIETVVKDNIKIFVR